MGLLPKRGWLVIVYVAAVLSYSVHENARAARALDIKSINGRTFKLAQGPANRCPEKLGIQTNLNQSEILIYPMELEWEAPRMHVNPILVVRGIRRAWEPEQAQTISVGRTTSVYSAILGENEISSINTTKIEDSMSVESHAKLEFDRNSLEMTRWSASNGLPLSDELLCKYKDAHIVKTAHSLAR